MHSLFDVVGYALARPGVMDVPPYDSELVSMHVRRLYQGLGVGRALLQSCMQALQVKGCSSMMLWVMENNTPARSFYEHLGGSLLAARQLSQGIAAEVAYGWSNLDEDYLINRFSR